MNVYAMLFVLVAAAANLVFTTYGVSPELNGDLAPVNATTLVGITYHEGHLRNVCHCQPEGPDYCNDMCRTDEDCLGRRKCYKHHCRRICRFPPYRPKRRCPLGEEYMACSPFYHHHHQPCTFVNVTQTVPAHNETDCVAGCYCPPGYERNKEGRCVKYNCTTVPEIHPQVSLPICTGQHEVYHTCFRGCQPSCANPKAEGCAIVGCDSGCFCQTGYYRNRWGLCVLPGACPQPLPPPPPPQPSAPICPPNQEFSLCRRQCEATCAHPVTTGCFRSCQVGCFCVSPFVRDHTGKCITEDTCIVPTPEPPVCPDFSEIYLTQQTKCQGTCDNPTGEGCKSRPISGCYCKGDLVRLPDGHCGPITACPLAPPPPPPPVPSDPICPSDYEDYDRCHRGCQKTCGNPNGEGCSMDQCVSGCFCQSGTVRGPSGKCIRLSQCPQQTCGVHEYFDECGSNCAPPLPCPAVPEWRNTSCVSHSCVAGCYCEHGYVRNETDHTCVPLERYCSYGQGFRCAIDEDITPCGNYCTYHCSLGWAAHGCPYSCRQRCCRRRR